MIGWSRRSVCPAGVSSSTRCAASIDDSPGPPGRKTTGLPCEPGIEYSTTGRTTASRWDLSASRDSGHGHRAAAHRDAARRRRPECRVARQVDEMRPSRRFWKWPSTIVRSALAMAALPAASAVPTQSDAALTFSLPHDIIHLGCMIAARRRRPVCRRPSRHDAQRRMRRRSVALADEPTPPHGGGRVGPLVQRVIAASSRRGDNLREIRDGYLEGATE